MSTSSLASCCSDGTSGVSDASFAREAMFFDKCPRCKLTYDFLRRNNASKVPLILNCKHTVCEDCIRNLCFTNCMICPVCKEQFVVPRTQIDSLTDLFTPHLTLIGYLMWSKNSPNKKQINWVSTGVTLKSKQNVSTDSPDMSTEIDDKSENESTESDFDKVFLSFEFDKCVEHNDSFMNIHCENCDDTICCYCFVENHAGHKPIHLYKLNDTETSELLKLKVDAEIILRQLHLSQKKAKELKSFDSTHVEIDIRKYFSDLHAKLHLAERNIRKKLSHVTVEESNIENVNATLKSAIFRVTQVLQFFNAVNTKQINVRALYEEIQELKNIPCRLSSDQDSLVPIEFVTSSDFDDIENYFSFKKSPCWEYNLLPIDDWNSLENEHETLENGRKIEFRNPKDSKSEVSAFQSVSIPKKIDSHSHKSSPYEGGKVKIIVTHLNDLNSFYVQKCSVQSALKNMNRTIGKKVKRKLTAEDIIIGRVYGVLYETKHSSNWRRGKLVNVFDKQPDDALYSMFFIDYGNTQCVTKDKLKEIDFYLVKRMPYAFECKLSNPNNIDFDANAHLHLPQIISERELYLQFVKKQSNGVHEVDLLVPSSCGDVVSVRDILLKSPSSIPEKKEVFLPTELKLFKNSKKFSVGQEEEVIITHVTDPFHISVQLLQNFKVLKKMKNAMEIFYENQRVTSCVPIKDTNVVIKYEHEYQGNWHRSKITSVDNVSKHVDVFFVDWGGSATVPWSNVKLLIEDFTKIECQAIIVKLADIENTKEQWSQEAINFLNDQVSVENKFKMVISNVDPLEVVLLQEQVSVDICLNSLLVENHHAVSTGTLSETLYWPNQQDVEEIDNDDDDLSSQLIKKSEEIIIKDEDEYLKDGIKQQISIVHFESPDLIFMKFTKYKQIEEDMQKELHIHYNALRKNKEVWKPSEYCIIYDNVKNSYFRGIIKSASGPNAYEVYLYDHVRHLRVPKNLIFVQDPYFKRIPCYTSKCRLANIKPAGDLEKWSQLAIEMLQKIFSTYKVIYVKKIETNQDDKIFGVIMWYSLITPAKALEPSKQKFISINKALIESGVAFSASSARTVFNNVDKNSVTVSDTLFDDNVAFKRMENSSDNKPTDTKPTEKNWYEMICEDEELFSSPLTSWPQPLRLEMTEFDAFVTCVDTECCFSIRHEEMQSLYIDMENNLKSKFSTMHFPQENVQWRPNEMCTISYENNWYRGTVIQILSREKISVEMIDFGSEHEVNKNQLYKQIMYPDMPPLINKIQLYDVHSKFGQWSSTDLDEFLKNLPNRIRVVIKGNLNCDVPFAEVYLEDGLSVNDLIIQQCPHLVRHENQVSSRSLNEEENNYEVVDTSPELNEDDDNLISDPMMLTFTFAALPKLSNGKCKMFVVNILKLDTEFNAILNVLNKDININSEEFKTLSADIQNHIDEQPTLQDIDINEPCVCFHLENNEWCRALVYDIDSMEYGYVFVFFVDYGTVDMITIENLKVMRPEWFNLPVYNRIAKINIEVIQSSRAEHVSMQMNNLRGKSTLVDIISEDPLKVHLYEGNNLCYQNFINCGIVTAL